MLFRPPRLAPIPDGHWASWSRKLSARPAEMPRPDSSEALARTLREAPGPVRVVGGNHSFTPLVATEGSLISLDNFSGVESTDPEGCTAWVRAGTRLRDLSPALDEAGLAFRNLGDIDVQSVAGAVATGTHGSGRTFPCLSGEILALRLMRADGHEITITGGDALRAARVSLGVLGVVTAVQLNLRPRLRLHRRSWVEPIELLAERADSRWQEMRNFEFFWVPFSGHGLAISHEETTEPDTPRAANDDDASVMQAKLLRDLLSRFPGPRRAILSRVMRGLPPEDVIGKSYALLASDRNVPFNEMEYHLPVSEWQAAFKELRARIRAERRDIFFPVEIRMTAGDDGMLSPFAGGARVSVAVHGYFRDDHQWFYDLAEPIFRAAGGRPHWGKCHSLRADDVASLYPELDRFRAIRAEFDPDRRFVTPYLAELLGI